MCMHHILVWSLQNRHAHFLTHPGCPHLHWESPLCIEASHSSMYNSICTLDACTCTCLFHDVCWPTLKCILSARESFPRILDSCTCAEYYSVYRGQFTLHCVHSMCVRITSDCGHFEMNCALSHASWTPAPTLSINSLWTEASMHSSVYNSTSRCMMRHAYALNLILVTLKWTCALSPHILDTHLHWSFIMCVDLQNRCTHAHHLLGTHSSMYTSTSKCIMCACASYLIMVTLKLICTLSMASWTPWPAPNITFHALTIVLASAIVLSDVRCSVIEV